MVYHAKVVGPGGRIYQCEHNHRTETAAITCARSSRTREMAAMVWQREAVRQAQAAELARQRREAKAAAEARRAADRAAAEARRAANRAAAEQARADKRAAKLAAMSPEQAWKRMTPGERLLRTADLEMETHGEIRTPEAKAAYDARAAKRATLTGGAAASPAAKSPRARWLAVGAAVVMVIVLAVIGSLSSGHHSAPATASAAATAGSTPTAAPTPTTAPVPAPLTLTTSVTRKHPFVGTKAGVTVSTSPGARITAVAHFPSGNLKRTIHADAAGLHTFWYPAAGALLGYRVYVTIRAYLHGQKQSSLAWFTPRLRPPPPAPALAPAPASAPAPSSAAPPPAPAGCYPTTSSGNCYEPGEFCPEADAGMTGIARDGERITCVLESGRYHWHPV